MALARQDGIMQDEGEHVSSVLLFFLLGVQDVRQLCELGISTRPCASLKNVLFIESFSLPFVAYNSWLCLSSNA